jgi:hypothetical protein
MRRRPKQCSMNFTRDRTFMLDVLCQFPLTLHTAATFNDESYYDDEATSTVTFR